MADMKQQLMAEINSLADRFRQEVQALGDADAVQKTKVAYLGKKGHLQSVFRQMGGLSSVERPDVGAEANRLKQKIEKECDRLLEQLLESLIMKKIDQERLDVTLSGRSLSSGSLHPITLVLRDAEAIFTAMGFSVKQGPEIETEYYNFEALNMPADHPARDMQDTFYIGGPVRTCRLRGKSSDDPQAPAPETGKAGSSASRQLLRTHTSPVQIHVMKKKKPPIRMIAPGAVYRRDSDVTHAPMFYQIEGLLVDEGITFADLKGVVSHFLHQFFGSDYQVRFRPSFFPFTEPSAEVDIRHREFRGGDWMEVMGCGMVDPEVFKAVGYDRYHVTGFAFGMGIERLAMLKYGIQDIRLFSGNDLRFLRQF